MYYKVVGDKGNKKDIDISGCLKLSEREALRFKRRVEQMGYKNVRLVERMGPPDPYK